MDNIDSTAHELRTVHHVRSFPVSDVDRWRLNRNFMIQDLGALGAKVTLCDRSLSVRWDEPYIAEDGSLIDRTVTTSVRPPRRVMRTAMELLSIVTGKEPLVWADVTYEERTYGSD